MKTSFALVILILGAVPPANAQVLEAAGGTAMAAGALSSLAQDLGELANKLQAEATLTSFNIRSDLLVLAENVSRLAMKAEGKVVKDLTAAEQKFIGDVRLLVSDFNAGNAGALEELNKVVKTLGQEVARLPGVSNAALVTAVRPTYAVVKVQDPNEAVEFVVDGSMLGRGEQTLSFGSYVCATLTATEQQLRFRCAASKIWSTPSSWASGKLKISKDSEWWKFWTSDEVSEYPAAIRRIDRTLGVVEVRATIERQKTVRKDRNEERIVRSGPCQTNNAAWTLSPSAGCLIDVTTIKAPRGPVSSWSKYHGIQRTSETGFVVTASSVGTGERLFGKCVGGGDGVVISRPSWVDVCTEDVQEQVVVAKAIPLLWGSDYSVDLPPRTDGFLISVVQANGETKSFAGADTSEWLRVIHDAVASRVIVRPKPIGEAFR